MSISYNKKKNTKARRLYITITVSLPGGFGFSNRLSAFILNQQYLRNPYLDDDKC